jgi:hypothetical protein
MHILTLSHEPIAEYVYQLREMSGHPKHDVLADFAVMVTRRIRGTPSRLVGNSGVTREEIAIN